MLREDLEGETYKYITLRCYVVIDLGMLHLLWEQTKTTTLCWGYFVTSKGICLKNYCFLTKNAEKWKSLFFLFYMDFYCTTITKKSHLLWTLTAEKSYSLPNLC
jgi:hypothetical protein